MSEASAIRTAASELRAARDELLGLESRGRRLGLASVAAAWLDHEDPIRREALARLPRECGLSEAAVAWGLDRAFEVITEDALEAWWDAEGSDEAPQFGLSAHIWAGNVFSAGLPPVLASLLAGTPCLIKSSSSAPSFASLWVRSLEQQAPGLGRACSAASWARGDLESTEALLAQIDLLFAFGDDASLDAIQSRAGSLPMRRFGSRYSVAAVGESWEPEDAGLAALLVDHLAWDGAGCLSPRWVFVEGGAPRTLALARRTAELAPAAVSVLPGLPLDAGRGAQRMAWLAQCAFAGWSAFAPGWAVASLPDAQLAEVPPRALCFLSLDRLEELPSVLRPLGTTLQGLSWLGNPARCESLAGLLAPLGLSRLAPAGRLQCPPVDWNHDDVRILASCF